MNIDFESVWTLFKSILILMERHQYLTTIVISVVSSLLTTFVWKFWLYKNVEIKINTEVEKTKYEMQRKYFNMEIKAKNLLEIYPKLFGLIKEAGSLIVIFFTINKKISESSKDESSLRLLIKDEFENFIESEGFLGLEKIIVFSDYYEAKSLFISDSVSEITKNIKKLLMELYCLAKNEIFNGKYQEYNKDKLMDLMKSAEDIIDKINGSKDKMQRQMNVELKVF